MPDFPRYQSKAQLTTQQPSAMAPDDTSGEIAGEVARIGGQLLDASMKWANAVDTIQKNSARANYKMGMADIMNRAQNEPDYNNSTQYFKEIEDLKKNSLKGFDSKRAQSEAELELNLEAKTSSIAIENMFKKKFVAAGTEALNTQIELEVNNPSDSSMSNIQKLLNENTIAGIISEDQREGLYQTAKQKVAFNRFTQDFMANPLEAEQKFETNGYGMDVPTQSKARSKLNQLKTMQRAAEGDRYGEMSLLAVTGDLDESVIDQAIEANKQNANEGITEIHGKQLKAALYRDINARIKAKHFDKYRKALDYIFTSSGQDKIKGYEAVLEAYNNGITSDEAQFLKQIMDTKKDIVFAEKAARGKKFLEMLLGAKPKNVEEETQTLLNYAKRIAEGSEPEEAARDTAMDVMQKDHPALVGDPSLAATFSLDKGFSS